jgi:putative ABC transport system ATP-binding protein
VIRERAAHDPGSPGTAAIVAVRGVSRTYGHGHGAVTALRDVTFQVRPASLVAITGRSGSGKTTLLNLIGGLDTPTTGTILVGGRDVTRLTEHERTMLRRHHVSFIFQSFALLPTLSAYENVLLALHIARVPARERSRRARGMLQLVGLRERLDHRPYELSGGEQERVAIARALATGAPLILADEPTGELDTATGHEIVALLAEVVREQGVAVLVATHDPTVVAAADHAYRLVDGALDALEGSNGRHAGR